MRMKVWQRSSGRGVIQYCVSKAAQWSEVVLKARGRLIRSRGASGRHSGAAPARSQREPARLLENRMTSARQVPPPWCGYCVWEGGGIVTCFYGAVHSLAIIVWLRGAHDDPGCHS
jgi:hypothetical protein